MTDAPAGPDAPDSPEPSQPPEELRESKIVRTGQLIRSALRKFSGFSWKRDWADDDPKDPKVVARVKPTGRHEDAPWPTWVRALIVGGIVTLILAGIWIGTRLASQAPVVPDTLF